MKFLRKLFGIKSDEEKRLIQKEWDEMKEGLKNKVSDLTQPAVHLIKTSEKTNSKLGGKPIVESEDFIWPRSDNAPMTFLAQLDLSEISRQYNYDWLADEGSILFFYDVKAMPWGYDPKDKGKWKVIYQSAPNIEIDYPSDMEKKCTIAEHYIRAKKIEILPSFEDLSIERLNLSDEEIDLYIEIDEHYDEFNCHGDFPAHQVGGFPQPIQGDEMQFEAKMASNGIYMGDGKAYKNATREDFETAKNEWELLFQFDSDEEINAMWGDLGMLYFWVEPEKSKANNFSDVWLILQCT